MKKLLKELAEASVPVSEIQDIVNDYYSTDGMTGVELFNRLKNLLSKYKRMNEKLVGGQKKLDVAPPKGKITGADFEKLRSMKEGGDHEVAMAQSSLEAIIKAAQELMAKLGDNERNIPGWIQNHITNSENYIEQAAQGFHELEGMEAPEEETSLVSMMEDLTTDKKKEGSPIKSKSEFSLKLRDIANKVQNMQGVDTKEAQNILNLLQDMLNKSQVGSIGTNIGKTTRDFDRSTINIKPKA